MGCVDVQSSVGLRRCPWPGSIEIVLALHIRDTRSSQGCCVSLCGVAPRGGETMDIRKNKVAAALAGLLSLGGVGAAVVVAGMNGPAGPATVRVQPASASQAPAATPPNAPPTPGTQAGSATATSEPAGPDTDNVQEGDQASPDNPNEGDEKEGTDTEGTEKGGAEEPGEENLPGGGHADPQGQAADHQIEGVE